MTNNLPAQNRPPEKLSIAPAAPKPIAETVVPPVAEKRKVDKMAIVALILSLIPVVVTAIAAIFIAVKSIGRLKATTLRGKRLDIAAIVISGIQIVLAVVFALTFVFPSSAINGSNGNPSVPNVENTLPPVDSDEPVVAEPDENNEGATPPEGTPGGEGYESSGEEPEATNPEDLGSVPIDSTSNTNPAVQEEIEFSNNIFATKNDFYASVTKVQQEVSNNPDVNVENISPVVDNANSRIVITGNASSYVITATNIEAAPEDENYIRYTSSSDSYDKQGYFLS